MGKKGGGGGRCGVHVYEIRTFPALYKFIGWGEISTSSVGLGHSLLPTFDLVGEHAEVVVGLQLGKKKKLRKKW